MFRRKKKKDKKKNPYPGEAAYLANWDSKPVEPGRPPNSSKDDWQPSPENWPKEQAKPVSKSVWQPPPEDWPADAVEPVLTSPPAPKYEKQPVERLPPVNPEYTRAQTRAQTQVQTQAQTQAPPPSYDVAMQQQQSMYPQLQQRPMVQQAAPAYTPYQQPSPAVQMTIGHHQASVPSVQAPSPVQPVVQYPPPPPKNTMYGDDE